MQDEPMVIKAYYTPHDIQKLLGVARGKSYRVIKELNDKARDAGQVIIRGRVSKEIFNAFYNGKPLQK